MPHLTFPIEPDELDESAVCPGCSSTSGWQEIAQVATTAGTTFLTTDVCRRCAMIFRRRRPSQAWFERARSIRDAAQRRGSGVPINPETEALRYARYVATAELLKHYGFGRRIIDIGCGPATGLRAFAEAGLSAVGLEPDQSRARFVKVPDVEIVEATVEQYASNAREQFDGAACQHSLEHFHQPREALSAVASLVAVGGLIYVEVPDWRHSVRDWNDALYLAHLSNFVEESLVHMAARVGLSLVGREYPTADAAGETHLACVFRKATRRFEGTAAVAPDVPEAAHRVYCRNLPGTPPAGPLRFAVPCINDISLTFKGDPLTVRAKVHDNFVDRTVELNKHTGVYHVRATE